MGGGAVVGIIAGTAPDWIGSGYGYGDGYGYGYGYGYGDGSGYGYGDGDGYGDGKYWLAAIAAYALTWPAEARARATAAMGAGATLAYWRSDKNGRPCNGGRGEPARPGKVETINGPLKLCGSGALHATHLPHRWNGERLWVVALYGEIAKDTDKMGALKREIIWECLPP